MATRWSRRYFRLPAGLTLEDARDRLGDMEPVAPDSHVAVAEEGPLADTEAPSRREREYSELPEVVYVGVNAGVGLFVYTRWVRGELARHLYYSADEGWVRVDGEPEPWEAEAIFGVEAREHHERYLGGWDAAEVARAREVFDSGRLVAGSTWPVVDPEQLSWSLGVPQ
ncbi:MAG: hypothetical protein AB7N76_26995 [Planctomycetota bacterium]